MRIALGRIRSVLKAAVESVTEPRPQLRDALGPEVVHGSTFLRLPCGESRNLLRVPRFRHEQDTGLRSRSRWSAHLLHRHAQTRAEPKAGESHQKYGKLFGRGLRRVG